MDQRSLMQASDGKAQQQQLTTRLCLTARRNAVSFLLVIALPSTVSHRMAEGTEGRGGAEGKCAPASAKALAWNWVLE